MTPYNTGKVKIGLRYTQAPSRYSTKDASDLQRELLRKPSHAKAYAGFATCCIAAVGFAALIVHEMSK